MKEVLHIYKRVSSLSQVEGSSLKTQSEIGIKLAKQLNMDYEVHDEDTVGKFAQGIDFLTA
ncbi:MAG: hypothetical protein O3C19_04620, partial [Bacteroidetes bacterium]|nr:hypothetical protein [Bacteroidota bacterium]